MGFKIYEGHSLGHCLVEVFGRFGLTAAAAPAASSAPAAAAAAAAPAALPTILRAARSDVTNLLSRLSFFLQK